MLIHASKLVDGKPIEDRIAECGVIVSSTDKKAGLTVSLHAVNCGACKKIRMPFLR